MASMRNIPKIRLILLLEISLEKSLVLQIIKKLLLGSVNVLGGIMVLRSAV
jgi:hypothetical protein